MSDNFEEQKEKLVSIKHEISLLYQQVNYLLRNEKPLGLLDLDVLMNRTHTLYDLLCTVNLGENPDDEEFDIDPEAFAGLFGMSTEEEPEETPEPATETEEIPIVEEQVAEEEEIVEEIPEEPIEEPEQVEHQSSNP